MQRRVYAKTGQKKRKIGEMTRVYLDHAATTPLLLEAQKAMAVFECVDFGNPSSLSKEGVTARKAVEDSRGEVARLLGVLPSEIVFTSGGTESNNLAISGVLSAHPHGHAVVSMIEHPSVLEPVRAWEKAGGQVSWIAPNEAGIIEAGLVRRLIRKETVLVSVMLANNEVGTIQPIREIAKAVRSFRKALDPAKPFELRAPFFHVDACQAPGVLPLELNSLGADLVSFSSQKFYGPKGAGFLFVRRGITLMPHMRGGGHEGGVRAGTENVPAIVGTAVALQKAVGLQKKELARLTELRDWTLSELLKLFRTGDGPRVYLNGSAVQRLPSNINISFPGIPSEVMVLGLDALGFSVSAGSACGTHDAEPSYVLTAMGLSPLRTESAVRITLGRSTKKSDMKRFIEAVRTVYVRQAGFIRGVGSVL